MPRLSYVKIYEASLFALAVQRPDGLLNHEEVVKELTDLTVSYDAGLGIRGDFPEVLQVVLKVEKHQYQKAIAWYVPFFTRLNYRLWTNLVYLL
jgi:hypothetical protein